MTADLNGLLKDGYNADELTWFQVSSFNEDAQDVAGFVGTNMKARIQIRNECLLFLVGQCLEYGAALQVVRDASGDDDVAKVLGDDNILDEWDKRVISTAIVAAAGLHDAQDVASSVKYLEEDDELWSGREIKYEKVFQLYNRSLHGHTVGTGTKVGDDNGRLPSDWTLDFEGWMLKLTGNMSNFYESLRNNQDYRLARQNFEQLINVLVPMVKRYRQAASQRNIEGKKAELKALEQEDADLLKKLMRKNKEAVDEADRAASRNLVAAANSHKEFLRESVMAAEKAAVQAKGDNIIEAVELKQEHSRVVDKLIAEIRNRTANRKQAADDFIRGEKKNYSDKGDSISRIDQFRKNGNVKGLLGLKNVAAGLRKSILSDLESRSIKGKKAARGRREHKKETIYEAMRKYNEEQDVREKYMVGVRGREPMIVSARACPGLSDLL